MKKWTEREEQYMISKYLHQPVKITADRLDRTVSSVKHKAARLGLNKYNDELCLKQIALSFNVDYAVPLRWVEKFGLPLSYSKNYGHMTRRFIDSKQFWKWAKSHKHLIPWNKYEPFSILPQPDWVSECIRDYKYSRSRKRLTSHEKSLIIHMREQGASFKEIAERFERTEESIRHVWRSQ